MLETIKNQLKKFPLNPAQPSRQDSGSLAAVMVLLHGDQDNPQVVLTQRAMHLNNHAGEVAFPGGMWDRTDRDLLHTALRETEEEIANAMKSQVPAGRFGEANEVANAVAFLCTPAAAYINGINVPVDGGRTKSL